jgi:hypothetical protein
MKGYLVLILCSKKFKILFMRRKNSLFVLLIMILITSLMSQNIYSQEFYNFSNKTAGDYNERGRLTFSASYGAGFTIKSTKYFSAEYGSSHINGSAGINIFHQTYSDKTLLDFQNQQKILALNIFIKKIFYSNSERFLVYGSGGGGVVLSRYERYGSEENRISFFCEIGSKYKINKHFGVLFNAYTTGWFDISGGLGLSYTL